MLICYDLQNHKGCHTENPDGTKACLNCNRDLRFALHLHNPGTVIRHYRIVRVIGYGGMGAVYEAEDTHQPGYRVALKESFGASGMSSFQREFTALQQLQHPHLPRYEAMFDEQDNGYLVMELIVGQNLHDVQVAANGPLAEPQVLGFALQLCEVLSYLHRQRPPIIHRDVKPANIRLTPGGLIKLVDFGLFKQGTGQDITRHSRFGLTPGYAPLEQYLGLPGHTNPRSDVYSLGATLYDLLSGQPPLAANDREGPTDPLLPLARLNPRLSPHVAAAITKALSRKPEERYPTIETFRQALVGQRQPLPLAILLGAGLVVLLLAVFSLAFANRGGTLPPTSAPVATTVAVAVAPTLARTAVPPTLVPTAIPPTLTPTAVPPTATPTVAPSATTAPTTQPAWVPEMVAVPAGSFLMGSSSADAQAQSNEQPQHQLELPAYWIGKTEVTNAQFRPFVESDGYTNPAYWTAAGWAWRQAENITQPYYWNDTQWNGPDYPVVGVSWFEAVAYCRWLSKQTGITFRLPSEAEWEYAARGPKGLIYPWGNTWDAKRTNSSESGLSKTTPVGSYPTGASPFGAMDMAGNVWEWCATQWQKPYPYQIEDEWQAAYLEANADYRVVRGGSWYNDSTYVRGAYRGYYYPRARGSFIFGLRVASHSLMP